METLENWHKSHLKGHKKATEKILRQRISKARRFSGQWAKDTIALASQLTMRKRAKQAKPLFDELVTAVVKKQIALSDSDLVVLSTMKGAADIELGCYDSAEIAINDAMELDKSQAQPKLIAVHLTLLARLFSLQPKNKELLDTQKTLVNHFLENRQIDRELYECALVVVKVLEKEDVDKAQEYRQDIFERISKIISERPIEQHITPLLKNWSQDPITEYLEASRQNEVASLLKNKDGRQAINLMDGRFRAGLSLMRSEIGAIIRRKYPKQKITDVKLADKDWLEVFFLMRCHASFLCSARLALSGAIAETYMALRGCLENALYAYHVKKVPAHKGLWFGRKNPQTKSQLKREFQIQTIIEELAATDASLSAKAEALYNHVIEKGAHPTLDTFTGNAWQGKSESELVLGVYYLNPDLIDSCVDDILEVAEYVIKIYRFIYPDLMW